jgi:hypothetical protein
MNEFTSAPCAVMASVSTSDIDRNTSVTVTFSTDPFIPYFPETILVSGIHPKLGHYLHYDIDIHRYQLIIMAMGTPWHRRFQWKSSLRSVYSLSIDMMSVHTVADVRLVISEASTKDYAPNCPSVVGLPQLYLNQIHIMRRHIDNTVLTVVHKAITGPKLNHRTLQKQLSWKDWLATEWIQLDNYAKQNMYCAPCTAFIDQSIFFWVWLY